MSGLKVLSVASEIFPIVKTGGLADVAGALPSALKHESVEMRTLVPAYPAVKEKPGRKPFSEVKKMKDDPAAVEKLSGEIKAHYSKLFGV